MGAYLAQQCIIYTIDTKSCYNQKNARMLIRWSRNNGYMININFQSQNINLLEYSENENENDLSKLKSSCIISGILLLIMFIFLTIANYNAFLREMVLGHSFFTIEIVVGVLFLIGLFNGIKIYKIRDKVTTDVICRIFDKKVDTIMYEPILNKYCFIHEAQNLLVDNDIEFLIKKKADDKEYKEYILPRTMLSGKYKDVKFILIQYRLLPHDVGAFKDTDDGWIEYKSSTSYFKKNKWYIHLELPQDIGCNLVIKKGTHPYSKNFIETEDISFNENYSIHGDNEKMAFKILSPKRLIRLRDILEQELVESLKYSSFQITFANKTLDIVTQNRVELKIKPTIHRVQDLSIYERTADIYLNTIKQFIDQLELDNKIYGKGF